MKQPIIVLISLHVVATILVVGLWVGDHRVAAAVIGTATLTGWGLLVSVGIFAAGSWWSKVLIESGADIALRSQESDDRRDVAMVNALTKMTGWWKDSQPTDRLALPLPSQQQGDWLPELSELVDGEIVAR